MLLLIKPLEKKIISGTGIVLVPSKSEEQKEREAGGVYIIGPR